MSSSSAAAAPVAKRHANAAKGKTPWILKASKARMAQLRGGIIRRRPAVTAMFQALAARRVDRHGALFCALTKAQKIKTIKESMARFSLDAMNVRRFIPRDAVVAKTKHRSGAKGKKKAKSGAAEQPVAESAAAKPATAPDTPAKAANGKPKAKPAATAESKPTADAPAASTAAPTAPKATPPAKKAPAAARTPAAPKKPAAAAAPKKPAPAKETTTPAPAAAADDDEVMNDE